MSGLDDILGMKQYLMGMSFSKPEYLGRFEDHVVFKAFCEDNEENCDIQFVEHQDDEVYVYVRWEGEDVYNTFDKLVDDGGGTNG